MRRSRVFLVVTGVLGAVLLFAAACAPAAKPTGPSQPAPSQQSPNTAEKPSGVVEQPAPASSQKPAQEQAADTKVATSTSGVPLDPTAKFGGIMQVAYTAEGPTFSNWEEAAGVAPGPGHMVGNMIARMRSWGSPEDEGKGVYWEIHPDLAASWEQSADGLKWTFKFRDGVTVADGDQRIPFTCRDAKWSLDTIRTGQGLIRSPRAVHFLAIKDIQCADDLTMVINMKYPKPGLLEMIAMPYHVIKPQYRYEGKEDDMRKKPNVGTGPFVLKEWVPGEKYSYVRRSDYWDKPFPYLDGVEMRLLAPQAQVAAYRAGRLDIGPSAGQYSGARAEQLIKECTLCDVRPRTTNIGISNVVHVNHQRAPWNTPEVKDAISLAFDRKKALKVLAQDWGVVPMCGPLHPGTQWCTPDLVERMKKVPGYNFDTPEQNLQTAKDLLAKAGFKPGELKATLRWWQSGGAAAPVTIMEDLNAAGFNIALEEMETARAYDSLTNAEFNLQTHGFWIAGTDPDVPLFEHFYTGSDRNYGRYTNPELDRMMEQMSRTVDVERRKQMAVDIAEALMKDQAKIIGYYSDTVSVYNKRLKGLISAPAVIQGYGPWQRFDHVWLDDTTK